MDNASIKDNIYRKRHEEGISQEEMARRLGMMRNSYRKIERGPVRLLSEHVESIAEVLGTTPEELVLGYKPLDGSGMLEDLKGEYDSRTRDLTENYEKTIARLKDELAARENEIRDLRNTIEDKNEIISLLKRKYASDGM
ncbi:MAG: helix-turn-helix domain-containing protein [Candidatus Cryptobacteroides sp.]